MKVVLTVAEIGVDGYWKLRDQLDDFVRQNFDMLYEGACRLGCNIPEDYYAPRRVQLNSTRLHARVGLKYAGGHRYDEDVAPKEENLRQTIADLQTLLTEAGKIIPAPFTIAIEAHV